jgi:hypothetical protein
MDRKGYQDLIHLTEVERAALSERLRMATRTAKGPKGERRRDKRWDFSQPDIAVCVEHPGGGISKFLVWARDISAGGMSFIHGGFLHIGSRCKIAPMALDGHRVAVIGVVTGCRLVQGRLHTISAKFEQRIDPAIFLADYVESEQPSVIAVEATPPTIEPIYTSLKGKDGDAEQVDRYIAETHAAAKRLADSMSSNNVAVVKELCTKIKGSAAGSGFESLGTIAGEALSLLDGGKSIADATAQLQQLRQLCERVSPKPPANHSSRKDDPPRKSH